LSYKKVVIKIVVVLFHTSKLK